MRTTVFCVAFLAAGSLFAAEREAKVADRLDASAQILNEMLNESGTGNAIPQNLIDKANCVVVIPNMKKGGFLVAGRYGRGFEVCRKNNGHGAWGAPAAVVIEGGSFGLQAGATNQDILMLVMNQKGVEDILKDKFTFGGEAAGAAGPVGRQLSAQSSGWASAGILTYGRSTGLFGGLSLEGASLRPDHDTNKELYGRDMTQRDILFGNVHAPRDARQLTAALKRATGTGNVNASNHSNSNTGGNSHNGNNAGNSQR